jgi:hypothetical protein
MRICRSYHPYWTDKAIALSNHSFEEAGPVGIISERGANFTHDVINVSFGVNEQIRAPQLSDNVLA